ncbi:hypothetical protein BgiBS90_020859, partial [Biomphalaria glabrata]
LSALNLKLGEGSGLHENHAQGMPRASTLKSSTRDEDVFEVLVNQVEKRGILLGRETCI